MADIKFTGLPAGVSPFDVDSVVAVSEDDGAGTFTSKKITLQQLRIALSVIDSAVDSIALSDSSGDVEVDIGNNYLDLKIDNANVYNDTYIDEDDVSLNYLNKSDGLTGSAVIGVSNFTKNASNKRIANITLYANDIPFISEVNANTYTTSNFDISPSVISGRNIVVTTVIKNATSSGGSGLTIDTDSVNHTQATSVHINDIGSTGANQTLTISDGAYIKITPTGNLTINVNTYSTNNSVNWTLEVDNSGGHTITQGTGIVNTAGGSWAAFGTGTEIISFTSIASGSHLLITQLPTVS